ncbi:SRPBCC domain-containing protein [Acinetobacter baumannii]|uniref:SRPBCC domain-containing protein n=1 Tax=Acinetobacter calcoaceticus/baumannii complex TaxID=909768 RepID=UPI003CC732D7
MQLTVETNVRAPIERVWEAYTTPDEIIRWNAASDDWHTTRAIVEECMRCHQWRSLRGRCPVLMRPRKTLLKGQKK